MEDAFPPNQPPPAEYPAVADEEEEDEEEEEEEHAEAPPVVVVAAAKKRGRPAGSKDVYTALLDRMTQLEETLTRRPPPQSSTGGTPEETPQRQNPRGRPGQGGWQWKHQRRQLQARLISSWIKSRRRARLDASSS